MIRNILSSVWTWFLILVSLSIIFILLNLSNGFLINRDSYQFLSHSNILNGSLGPFGDTYIMQFYNRVGYVYLTQFLEYINFVHLSIIDVLRALNYLFFVLTSIFIFAISFLFSKDKMLSMFTAVLYGTSCVSLFVSSLILNDTIATFLAVIVFYIVLQKKKFTKWVSVLFVVISTLRIEYMVLLIPLYFFIVQSDKDSKTKVTSTLKSVFITIVSAIFLNILLLLPFLNHEWFVHHLEVLNKIKFDIGYGALAIALLFIILKYIPHKVFILFVISLIISVIQFLDPRFYGSIELFIVSSSLILILTIAVLASGKWHRSVNKLDERNFVLVSLLFLFLIYRSFYFQHLSIILALLCIFIGLSWEDYPALMLKKYSKLFFSWAIILTFALNVFLYKYLFSKYDVDMAQKVCKIVDNFISEKGIKRSDTVLVSNYAEACYFWTDVSSRDLQNIKDLSFKSQNVIFFYFNNEIPTIPNYTLRGSQNVYVRVGYDFYEEYIGYNPEFIYIYWFSK
jgi:hypothetical protein